ncbi:hypothetical protein protein, putative [Babesia ovis]|uniref:Uncharacterized protein n=1 Tax=Babesia ovis TaxID=5869 RepID=A0A9W5T7V2_BABOV|nr:hypothetical protein protein, putative [Babesia ovis]
MRVEDVGPIHSDCGNGKQRYMCISTPLTPHGYPLCAILDPSHYTDPSSACWSGCLEHKCPEGMTAKNNHRTNFEPQTNTVAFPEECYASDVDEADAEFVRDTFGCSNDSGFFESSEALNVSVELCSKEDLETTADVSDDAALSTKRSVETEQANFRGYVARCDECRNVVATVDDQGTYSFRRVIASPP